MNNFLYIRSNSIIDTLFFISSNSQAVVPGNADERVPAHTI